MSWLFPGFLAGAAAALLPLALHLLRRWPRKPVAFPSLRFLEAGSRRIERWWQRLARWLVLLFRCAVFALLAAAFARPFHSDVYVRPTRAVVVVVDNSFSLQAKGRWAALQRWTAEQIGHLGPGDKLGLLLMAPQPTWVATPAADTALVVKKLQDLSPGWLTSRAEPALRFTADSLAALPAEKREIIVLGDEQRVSWSGADFSKTLPAGISVVFPAVPTPLLRQASLGAPQLATDRDGILATLQIHNYTAEQRRTLRVYRDGAVIPLREDQIDLGAQQTRTVALHLSTPTAKPAYFRFSLDSDDLPADDTAYSVWRPSGDGALILDAAPEGQQTDFVATALSASAGLAPSLRIKPVPDSAWPGRAVALLRNDASFAGPSARRLDDFLAAGGSALLFITGEPRQEAWLAGRGLTLAPLPDRGEPWELHDWATDHPLVAALSQHRFDVLLGWDFDRGWALPVDAGRPLAHWNENSASIVEMRVGSGHLLVCGFRPDRRDGDWPVSASFLPFLHEAESYLFRAQQAASGAGETGRTLALSGQGGKWRGVEGPAKSGPAVDVAVSVVPLAPGVYEYAQGTDRMLFAVNLPPEESDPASWTDGAPWTRLVSKQPAPESKAARVKLAAVDAEQQAPLWWRAVAAAAALMLMELVLANRTAR